MESSELLKRIRDELQLKIVKPPQGWKPSKEWALEWGLQQSQTNRLLSRAVAAGIMEQTQFRVACSNRGCYPVPHYRVKETFDSGTSTAPRTEHPRP